MLKALNIPVSEWNAASQAYAETACDALVFFSPGWNVLEPTKGAWTNAPLAPVDAQIDWAHAHGKQVLVVVEPSSYPAWSKSGAGRIAPADVSKSGPWANFLRTSLQHYKSKNVLPIILNEPDYAFADMPAGLRASTTATMIKNATAIAHGCGYAHILTPACATVSFAEQVLNALRGWSPQIKVGWSQHNYVDIMADLPAKGMPKAQALLDALGAHSWTDGIWFTEGGYVYSTYQTQPVEFPADPNTWHYKNLASDEQEQLRRTVNYWHWCKNHKVRSLANYEYQDSLWSGWASGMVAHDGTPHPLRDAWQRLT